MLPATSKPVRVAAIPRMLQKAPEGRPFLIGSEFETQQPIYLTQEQTAVHMAVLGGSGSGKSSFIELLLRQSMPGGMGFCYIDPHSDTANNLVAYAAAQKAIGDDSIWRKIHFIEIGTKHAVSYDPFAHLPLRSQVTKFEYDCLLGAKVDRVCRSLLRRVAEADLEIMNRLKKWLKCILYVCGTAIDDRNTHLGLDKMLIFTDPDNPDFERFLAPVREFLPDWVQSNLRRQQEARSEQIRDKLESTVNRLVDILSTLVREVFAQRHPSIDVGKIIRDGDFLIAALGQTPTWSHDAKVTFGGLLIDEVLLAKEAEEDLPPHSRKPFSLVIDESGEFLGEDLQRALGTHRKYKLKIILAAQDLSTLAKGDFDMAPRVLSQCGTVVCFQQTFRPDKEILADRLGAGNISFARLLQEVQRQRGWIEKHLEEHSYGTSRGESWLEGGSESEGDSENEVINEMIAVMKGFAKTQGTAEAEQHVETQGGTTGGSSSVARSLSPIIIGPDVVGYVPHQTLNTGNSASEHGSTADGRTTTNNQSETESGATTAANGFARGKGKTRQKGKNWSNGGTHGTSHNVAHKTMLLANIVSEYEWQGLYKEGAPADQFERLMQQIHCLSVAEAIVSCRGVRQSMGVKIYPVKEWWEDPNDKYYAIQRMKTRLRELRPYYFVPGETQEVDSALQMILNATHSENGDCRCNGKANGKPSHNGHANGKVAGLGVPIHEILSTNGTHKNGRKKPSRFGV